jgi:hypothetical protein
MSFDSIRATVAGRLPAGLARKKTSTAVVPAQTGTVAAPVALTRVQGNITWTGRAATAWYHLPEQRWAWQTGTVQDLLLDRAATQWATLAGRSIHLRRTTVPWPVAQWARDYDRDAAGRVLDRQAWARNVVNVQRVVKADGSVVGMTLLGVSLRGGRNATDDDVQAEADRIGADLADGGLEAEPASEHQIAWAVTRSLTAGLTPPARVDLLQHPEQVLALADLADWYREPYGLTTLVVNRHTGERRYTAVLTVGRIEPQRIPGQHLPWLHHAEGVRGGFPVEISVRGRITADDPRLSHKLKQVRAQVADYGDHGLVPPIELGRVADQAHQIEDDIATGTPEVACRAHLRVRLTVSGNTEQECLARVAELQRHYRVNGITLEHGRDQYTTLQSLCPGSPEIGSDYVRHMGMKTWAAALPQVGSEVGDGAGPYLGTTNTTGHRPVFWSGNTGPEQGVSGLVPIVGDPGAGKSTLIGSLAYAHALAGVQVTVLDPSGPLAALADVPELKAHTRVVDLTGSLPGTLAPYALVPEPRQHDHDSRRSFETAVKEARAEREALALDVMSMLLGPQFVGRENLILALRSAQLEVDPAVTATLDDIVAVLEKAGQTGDVDAKNVSTLLRSARNMPYADLFFGRPPAGVLTADASLTIITMAGLHMPDTATDRKFWSVQESIAVALLHTAYRLAVRRCYSGSMMARKMVCLDEAHILAMWASGRAFLKRLARDSRKWNLAALVASQNPADVLGLAVQNLVSTVFVGRITSDEVVAAEAVRLLGLPAGEGFEELLAGLSPIMPAIPGRPAPVDPGYREFVMRDMYKRVGRVAVSIDHYTGLAAHLNTTPGGPR